MLFDDFLVVGLAPAASGVTAPKLLYHFQAADAALAAAAQSVTEFCFPDPEDVGSPSESFTFTLTQGEGLQTHRVFGFCRRLVQKAKLPVCLCVLSQRAWFSLFMHMHDILQLNYDLSRFVPAFVSAAHAAALPPANSGASILVEPLLRGEAYYGSFRLATPEEDRPTGVQFAPLLEALGVPNALRVLAALLTEQRVVFIGARWGHVSGCAHAAASLLYPLSWQHIFIPVLPSSKLSYACAPMPFVLGVLSRHLRALQQEPIEQVLFVDLDDGRLWGDAEVMEAAQLPSPHREALTLALGRQLAKARSARLDNGAVAEAVLQMMVRMLGPYRRFVSAADAGARGGEGIHPDFDEEAFVLSAPAPTQPFLRAMRAAQLFEVFVRDHIGMSEQARQVSAFERAVSKAERDEARGFGAYVVEPAAAPPDSMRARAADKLRSGVATIGGGTLRTLRRGASATGKQPAEHDAATSSSRRSAAGQTPPPRAEAPPQQRATSNSVLRPAAEMRLQAERWQAEQQRAAAEAASRPQPPGRQVPPAPCSRPEPVVDLIRMDSGSDGLSSPPLVNGAPRTPPAARWGAPVPAPPTPLSAPPNIGHPEGRGVAPESAAPSDVGAALEALLLGTGDPPFIGLGSCTSGVTSAAAPPPASPSLLD